MDTNEATLEILRGIRTDLGGVITRLDGLNERVDGLNERVDGLNERVDGLDRRLEHLDDRFVVFATTTETVLGGMSAQMMMLSRAVTVTLEARSQFEDRLEDLARRVSVLEERDD